MDDLLTSGGQKPYPQNMRKLPFSEMLYMKPDTQLQLAQNKYLTFSDGSDGKESACKAGDLDSISGLGRSPGEGNGYPLQYFGLENSMGTGAWQAVVHGIAKRRTQLSDFSLSCFQLPPLQL